MINCMFLEIKFVGGLGNQLFQYATARRLCLKKKIPFLLLGTESYTNDSLGRKFVLSSLSIIGSKIKIDFFKKIFKPKTKLNKIFTLLRLHKYIYEQGFVLQTILEKKSLLLSLSGYWQSEHYFDDIRNILLKEFVPLDLPDYPNWINKKNLVAIHIRRQDYINEKRYGVLTSTYYEKGILLMKSLLETPEFIFFSDDIEWCKENFTDNKFIYCEDSNWEYDYLQLHLISKCKHQIVANSSFSWWGAWLNENPNKIVIRPTTPFIDQNLLYQSHYPANWLKIEN